MLDRQSSSSYSSAVSQRNADDMDMDRENAVNLSSSWNQQSCTDDGFWLEIPYPVAILLDDNPHIVDLAEQARQHGVSQMWLSKEDTFQRHGDRLYLPSIDSLGGPDAWARGVAAYLRDTILSAGTTDLARDGMDRFSTTVTQHADFAQLLQEANRWGINVTWQEPGQNETLFDQTEGGLTTIGLPADLMGSPEEALWLLVFTVTDRVYALNNPLAAQEERYAAATANALRFHSVVSEDLRAGDMAAPTPSSEVFGHFGSHNIHWQQMRNTNQASRILNRTLEDYGYDKAEYRVMDWHNPSDRQRHYIQQELAPLFPKKNDNLYSSMVRTATSGVYYGDGDTLPQSLWNSIGYYCSISAVETIDGFVSLLEHPAKMVAGMLTGSIKRAKLPTEVRTWIDLVGLMPDIVSLLTGETFEAIAERAKEATSTWEEGDHFGAVAVIALLYGDIKGLIELPSDIREQAQKARGTFAIGQSGPSGGKKLYPVTVGGSPTN